MKPGCFLKSIVILTIIIAVIMYIIQHKSELFFKPGKKIITGIIMDDWEHQFSFVKNTREKSELKNALETYIDSLKMQDIPDENEINKIAGMVKAAAADSIISSDELKEISKNIRVFKHEGPE
jgi:hypothetical protein